MFQTKTAPDSHREPRELREPGLTAFPLFACLVSFAVCLGWTTARAVEPGPDILLWPNGAPGSEGKTNLETVVRITAAGDHVLSNIHKPSITPYLPMASTPGSASMAGLASGCAVIVAPGGGHRELWSDHEGHNVARWLSDHGIAAFVLKYRLAKETNSTYTVDDHAVLDMQRALRLVRSRAAEWHIAPNRVGVMGFSAGGEVAFLTCQNAGLVSKGSNTVAGVPALPARDINPLLPAFQALIYPGRTQRIEPATNSPPVFLVCGYNDRADISEGLARVYLKFKEVKVPAELHIYAGSGHGFGFRPPSTLNPPPSTGTSKWIERFEEWLAASEFLKRQ